MVGIIRKKHICLSLTPVHEHKVFKTFHAVVIVTYISIYESLQIKLCYLKLKDTKQTPTLVSKLMYDISTDGKKEINIFFR